MTEPSKTIKSVLDAGTDYLAARKIENPRLACELLLARLLRCKRLELYLRYAEVLGEDRLAAMRRGIKRVGAGEPVQYVIGQTEFMGHLINVDRRVLIPRPETEGLVDAVLGCTDLWGEADGAPARPIIADVGTGSGCIAIALAKAQPQGVYIGLDVSAEALELARTNAAALGLQDKIAFAQGELPDCVEAETVTAIVSNPPYISSAQYAALPVHIREHEPRLALEAGANGLAVIEPLVQDAAMALHRGGYLFLEVGADQAQSVAALMEQAGFADLNVRKDLAGRDRIVAGRMP